jgi:hypothetical protein
MKVLKLIFDLNFSRINGKRDKELFKFGIVLEGGLFEQIKEFRK